jgi:hypothetical protein
MTVLRKNQALQSSLRTAGESPHSTCVPATRLVVRLAIFFVHMPSGLPHRYARASCSVTGGAAAA